MAHRGRQADLRGLHVDTHASRRQPVLRKRTSLPPAVPRSACLKRPERQQAGGSWFGGRGGDTGFRSATPQPSSPLTAALRFLST